SDTPTPHSHWITINEIGPGTIPFDQVILHGPAPRFEETAEAFEQQTFELTSVAAHAGQLTATIAGDNQIIVEQQNVERFSLWLHPAMVDFSRPVLLTVNQQQSSHQLRPDLLTALRSYQRLRDWSQISPAMIEISCAERQ
ncbi:MAG: hypothetical protein KDA85_11750, partial [Planctomycetaceae bacterium]|nr:hypothetical protein [Planctomycetaceae bacterium]